MGQKKDHKERQKERKAGKQIQPDTCCKSFVRWLTPCSAPLSSLAQHWIRGICYTSGKKGWSWQNISWAITGAISSLFVHPVQLQEHQHCSNTLSTPESPENCSISLSCQRLDRICAWDRASSGVHGINWEQCRGSCVPPRAVRTWHPLSAISQLTARLPNKIILNGSQR